MSATGQTSHSHPSANQTFAGNSARPVPNMATQTPRVMAAWTTHKIARLRYRMTARIVGTVSVIALMPNLKCGTRRFQKNPRARRPFREEFAQLPDSIRCKLCQSFGPSKNSMKSVSHTTPRARVNQCVNRGAQGYANSSTPRILCDGNDCPQNQRDIMGMRLNFLGDVLKPLVQAIVEHHTSETVGTSH